MSKLRCMGLSAWLLLSAGQVAAEDIDLFASGLASGAAADSLPNIIFVLDNTSNWSRQSQKWPDATQGQSEVRAIAAALRRLVQQNKDANIGLIEFTTDGTANQDGGYIRFDLQRLGDEVAESFRFSRRLTRASTTPSKAQLQRLLR